MPLRQLQERFDRLLDAVGLPEPFSLELFRTRLAEVRGRPLELVPFTVNDPDMPSGMWAALPDADVIFYELATSPLHCWHIVFHEIGHMVCGHPGRHDELLPFLARFLPEGCDPQRLREAFALQRASYTTQQEWEAEAFARYVGARVRRAGPTSAATAPPEVAGAFARAMDALGPRR